ncbi:MAG: hypothetical protein U5K69_04490 [Balneolaceae bacterium]|nr:hypothetical protein [Balneolaceae bacterium]
MDGHQYTLVLSHDIDSVYSGWLQDGYVALKNGNLGKAVEIFLNKLQGKDPWFNIEEILRFEQNHDVSSTFFFLPTQEEQNGIKHADYSIEDPAIKNSMNLIAEAGSEIGLHGDYEAHQSAGAMARSIQQINRPLQGNRFHYLMYNVHKTPGLLANSGLAYDSTLGFSEHIGFRNGYCHPFYLYDLQKNQLTDILEFHSLSWTPPSIMKNIWASPRMKLRKKYNP